MLNTEAFLREKPEMVLSAEASPFSQDQIYALLRRVRMYTAISYGLDDVVFSLEMNPNNMGESPVTGKPIISVKAEYGIYTFLWHPFCIAVAVYSRRNLDTPLGILINVKALHG